MAHLGFDCVFDASKFVQAIKASGFEFVGRYYFKASSYKTALTKAEVKALNAVGVSVVTVFEAASDHADYFSLDQGTRDAAVSLQQAQALGQPAMSPIYFAVDYDASPDEVENKIDPYFRGIGQMLAGKYRVGCYGSGLVLGTLGASALITHQWLGGAMGWRMSRGYAAAQIVQGLPQNLGFGEVDPNTATGDYGGWRLDADQSAPADDPASSHTQAGVPDDPIKTAIGSLQGVLNDGGFGAGTVDGIWGSRSAAAILAYNRSLPRR